MSRKGLFEWKILAAIFAVLIVLSSALVTNTGVKDFFLNLTGNLGDWMVGSPFGSLFSTPKKAVNLVVIKLITDNITLNMETPVNITAGGSHVSDFKGVVKLNFKSNSSQLLPVGSDMRLNMELDETKMKGVKIGHLLLKNVGFVVQSEKTNITASDDKIEIYDFSGDIIVTDHLLLTGNASKVKDEKWSIG